MGGARRTQQCVQNSKVNCVFGNGYAGTGQENHRLNRSGIIIVFSLSSPKTIALHSSKLVFHLEKRRRTRDHFAVACEFAARIRPEFAVLRTSGQIRSEFALRTNLQRLRRIQIEFAANLHPYRRSIEHRTRSRSDGDDTRRRTKDHQERSRSTGNRCSDSRRFQRFGELTRDAVEELSSCSAEVQLEAARELVKNLLETVEHRAAVDLKVEGRRADSTCKRLHQQIRVLEARFLEAETEFKVDVERADVQLGENKARVLLLERKLLTAMRSTWSSRNGYSISCTSSRVCVKVQEYTGTSSLRAMVASGFSVQRWLQCAMQGLLLTRVCSSARSKQPGRQRAGCRVHARRMPPQK